MTNWAACIQNNSTADEADQLQASHFPCTVTPRSLTPVCRKHTALPGLCIQSTDIKQLPFPESKAQYYQLFPIMPYARYFKSSEFKIISTGLWQKKQATKTNRYFLNVDDGTQTQIKKSDCITAEDQPLSRSIDMFSDPERKSYKTPCTLYYLMCCSLALVSILKYYMQN